MSAKTRETLIFLIFVAFFIYFLVFRSAAMYRTISHNRYIVHSIASILIIIMAALSMKGEIVRKKVNRVLLLPYVLFALGLIITGIMHPIGRGYLSFGIMLILVYPPFYLVWNNRGDYEVLLDKIANACLITGMMYFSYYVFLLISGREDSALQRQSGGMYNANFFAFIGVSVTCCAYYTIYRAIMNYNKKNALLIACGVCSVIIGTYIMVEGKGRSSLLISLASALCFLFFIIKNKVDAKIRKRVMQISFILLIVIAALGIIMIARSEPDSFLNRFSIAGRTADEFAAGRVRLWQSYASHLNMTGHDMDNVNWRELTAGVSTTHAHNNYLEYSYRCGIPVGLIYCAFHLVAMVLILKMFFRRSENKDWELFLVIALVHYTAHALVDIATVPFGSYGPFFFYFAIAPLFEESTVL